MTASGERLIAEALAKSGIIWLTSRSGSGPVWYIALNDVAYVVTGPGEQACPIHEGPTTIVTRSKETRARLLTYEADADVLTPEAEDWDAAVAALIAGRLNAPAGDVEARWRENNTILRFTPDTSSVIVRGEHVTAHEREVEPEVVEPEVTDTPETQAVVETAAPETTQPPATSQPAPARVNTPPSRTGEPNEKREVPAPRSTPSPRAADTQPIPVRPRKTAEQPAPEATTATPPKPASETTQPIPVRPRQRNTEQTQPIPVRAPARHPNEPAQREITEPIPVRTRNRTAAPAMPPTGDDVAPPSDIAKVDQ